MPLTFKLSDGQGTEINLTMVTDEVWPSLIEGLARLNGWEAEIEDPDNPGNVIPNPQTQDQAALNHFTEFLRNAAMEGFRDDLEEAHKTNVQNTQTQVIEGITNP